jgi:hypothetical protein
LEHRLAVKLKQERMERAKAQGKTFNEVNPTLCHLHLALTHSSC